MRIAIFAAAVAAIAACSKGTETQEAASAAPQNAEPASPPEAPGADDAALQHITRIDENAPAASGDERFYGREKFTIKSTQTGSEAGEIVEHVRDWGRRRVEIKDTTVSIGGMTHATSTRTIVDGAKMATVDTATGAVTLLENPLYDTIVARMKGKSGFEFGKELMTQMGGRATGETGSFAGESCEYWELASVGARTCVAPWGGTLHMVSTLGGFSFERTATEVRVGDGGPNEAFEYDESKATAAPDLGELMKRSKPE